MNSTDYRKMAEAIRAERKALWRQLGEPEVAQMSNPRQLGMTNMWDSVFSIIFPGQWTPRWRPWQDFVAEKKRKVRWFETGWNMP